MRKIITALSSFFSFLYCFIKQTTKFNNWKSNTSQILYQATVRINNPVSVLKMNGESMEDEWRMNEKSVGRRLMRL